MQFSKAVAGCAMAIGGLASTAGAHNHLTVDTVSGAAGDRIIIRAGYLPTEAAYSILGQRLRHQGEIAVYLTPETLPQPGPVQGWSASDALLLTSDYYFATGRLAGGDFQYELAPVLPVSGRPGPAPVAAWGEFDEDTGAYAPTAFSDGPTREARSYGVGVGGHEHAQAMVFTGCWVCDITVTAWDRNGRYTTSDPVTFRVDTGACPADIDRAGGLNIDDLFVYLNLWFAGDARADFDRSGTRDIDDIFVYLNAWFAGC